MLAPNDPATAKDERMAERHEEASPFKRAAKEMVSIEIKPRCSRKRRKPGKSIGWKPPATARGS
jgi:type IV secretory pathway TrbF-like protein